MLACCESMQSSNQFHDEWRSYLLITLAGNFLHAVTPPRRCFIVHMPCFSVVMDRDFAIRELTLAGGFGTGNSRTNSIYWAVTRSVPVTNLTSLNTSKKLVAEIQSTKLIEASCSMNSACDAIGKECFSGIAF
jgi:hypothetical protein